MINSKKITVNTIVNAAPEEVWEYLTETQYITKWNHTLDDWQTVSAENDFKVGGKLDYRMEAKDGSGGFNYKGTFDDIKPLESYSYSLEDNRKVDVKLANYGDKTDVIFTFDPEEEVSLDLQKSRRQSILDNLNRFIQSKL